jgi:hypothetical protein
MANRQVSSSGLRKQAGLSDEQFRRLLVAAERPSSPAEVAEAKSNLLAFFLVLRLWACDLRAEPTRSERGAGHVRVQGTDRPARKKRTSARRTLTAVALVLLLCSCRAHPRSAPAQSRPDPITLIGGLDGTGSYDRLDEARRQLGELIEKAPPGSDFIGRWISSDSYAAGNTIVSGSLPEAAVTPTNPFDRREKARVATQAEATEKAKKHLIQAIERAPSPRAGATDIFGLLAFASEVARRNHGRRVVVAMATDLRNNVNRYRHDVGADTLAAADVILLASAAPSPSARAEWERLLRSFGAVSVRAVSVGERVPADILEPGRGD